MILSISLNFILMKWIEGEGVEFPFFIFSILVFPTFFFMRLSVGSVVFVSGA